MSNATFNGLFSLFPNCCPILCCSHMYTTRLRKHDITAMSVPFISHADLYALGRSPWAVTVGWLRSFTHQPPLIDHWDGWVTGSCLWTGTSMRLGGGADSPALSFINPGYFLITHMALILLSLHHADALCRCISFSIFKLAITDCTCNNVAVRLGDSY